MARTKRSRHRGHATRFDGILYRSRLEARWAAFFRLVGWSEQTTYEPPMDLAFYIPDFALPWPDAVGECKPFLSLTDKSISNALLKARTSGLADKEIFLFGAKVFRDNQTRTVLGVVSPPGGGDSYLPFHLGRSEGTWIPCSRNDCDHGTGPGSSRKDLIDQVWIAYEWCTSGNLTQWKAPKEKEKK